MAVVLLCNIAFFTLMALVLPMQYDVNDDVMMCMIANGTYSGTPDGHLVYINVIYGYVLAWLYGQTTAIEWYTLSFVVLQILSMSVLCYNLLTIPNRARWERALWLLLVYVLWARFIVSLQFTTTAGLVCLAGCVLLLRGTPRSQWTGVAMVVIAALIRFMAAGLVGLLMAPIIIYTLGRRWRTYIPIVVMLVLVVGCRAINNHVYDSDIEWKNYREYNQLRAQLNDNPNAYRLYPNQLPEGVDVVDYRLLMGFIPDPEQIDLVRIRQLFAMVDSVPYRQQWRNLHRLDKYAVELSILLGLLILMIITTGNRRKYIFLIVYSIFVVGLIVHVSLDGFLKNRVFLCMLLPVLMTDFMLLPSTTGKKRKWGIIIVMLLLCGKYIWQTTQTSIEKYYARYNWTRLQQPILDYVPDDAYVVTLGAYMNMEAVNPWHVWQYPFHKYVLGWMTWIPFNTPIASSHRGLLRPDMYIFTSTDYAHEKNVVSRIQGQMEKHYGIATYVYPICHNGKYALIQLRAE